MLCLSPVERRFKKEGSGICQEVGSGLKTIVVQTFVEVEKPKTRSTVSNLTILLCRCLASRLLNCRYLLSIVSLDSSLPYYSTTIVVGD